MRRLSSFRKICLEITGRPYCFGKLNTQDKILPMPPEAFPIPKSSTIHNYNMYVSWQTRQGPIRPYLLGSTYKCYHLIQSQICACKNIFISPFANRLIVPHFPACLWEHIYFLLLTCRHLVEILFTHF